MEGRFGNIHNRIMKKNYEEVPQWWLYVVLVVMICLAMFACEGFDQQLQLTYWGIFLAAGLAFLFTLPNSIITATTNQTPGLNVITKLIIGYLYPGKPLANAIAFLSHFKLGHYMKIPPKSMFLVQLVGSVVASSAYFGTGWWLLEFVENICDCQWNLLDGHPWTCPNDEVFYNASIIWGMVGSFRMFGPLNLYMKTNWFFLLGLLAPVPVWVLVRAFPNVKWLRLINNNNIDGIAWWGKELDDHCPLAICPTAPGIRGIIARFICKFYYCRNYWKQVGV
ncbi:Oligopeptide transporter 1 [Acorus calamus]|uniref:Oligopeptide transporter 1 n=1 Tax=Acorus calamus TaxID=4465 RepID=A0AAV9ERI6_ACOCL|nr:Oligopeptide transporter 1 [Acorus calamus]